MIRDALAALGEAARTAGAITGVSLLIIAPFVLTYRGFAWILTGFLAWPIALWAIYQLDQRETR